MKAVAVFLFAAAAAGPALATTPYVGAATCPLTGEKVSYQATGSYSTWGQHLDGRPDGNWIFPSPLPLCKGSRFPAIEMEPADLAKARLLVDSSAWTFIQAERPYYILYRVRKATGAPPLDLGGVLLAATWEARADKDQYARYARELEAVLDEALPAVAPTDAAWWLIQVELANVLRQAGDFDAAKTRLAALTLAKAPPPAGFPAAIALTRKLVDAHSTEDALWPVEKVEGKAR